MDIKGQLSIYSKIFLNSGNIVSLGSMFTWHTDFNADKFDCNPGSFNFVEFKGHLGLQSRNSELVGAECKFYPVSKDTFAYFANLNSDAQSQINNVSPLHKI